MANLLAVRDGLKTRLETITGLRAHDTVPDQVHPPVAVVGFPDTIQFDQTFGRGSDRMVVPIRIYASKASERSGQDKLDGYCAGSGTGSVKEAIEGDETLGGVAHFCRVMEVRSFGVYTIAGIDYLGVEFVVEVQVPGDTTTITNDNGDPLIAGS